VVVFPAGARFTHGATVNLRLACLSNLVPTQCDTAAMPPPAGDMMRMRIAIIAASAGTFALAQTDPAQASYADASASIGTVTSPDPGSDPAIKLAKNQWGGKAAASGAFYRSTNGSFGRSTGGGFQRLPKSGRTRR
jgi:hypothetical protein